MDKIQNHKLILTEDGSHSIYVPALNETYHSSHGASQEAKHIFIQSALAYSLDSKKHYSILELGFGTGLNAWLTFLFSQERKIQISYTAIEKYPLINEEVQKLNYSKFDELESGVNFMGFHLSTWGRWNEIGNMFRLLKLQLDFRALKLEGDQFDVVFFDAFGPDVQPKLWTEAVFETIYASMKEGAILTTYSVKGKVRRALKAVGFEVEKIPGPPGKREITRAIKKAKL